MNTSTADIIEPVVSLEYIELPFFRIKPYKPNLDPFDSAQWPNEPDGWIRIPVVVKPSMSKDEILLEATTLRNSLIDKWLIYGNCIM